MRLISIEMRILRKESTPCVQLPSFVVELEIFFWGFTGDLATYRKNVSLL